MHKEKSPQQRYMIVHDLIVAVFFATIRMITIEQ